jgi:hypothetical protein
VNEEANVGIRRGKQDRKIWIQSLTMMKTVRTKTKTKMMMGLGPQGLGPKAWTLNPQAFGRDFAMRKMLLILVH